MDSRFVFEKKSENKTMPSSPSKVRKNNKKIPKYKSNKK